jgi:hypothetical protein
MAEKTYVLIPAAELTMQMVDVALETDFNTLRWNNDHTKTVLKWEGTKPPIFNPYTDYSHAQILVEMAKPEWTPVTP